MAVKSKFTAEEEDDEDEDEEEQQEEQEEGAHWRALLERCWARTGSPRVRAQRAAIAGPRLAEGPKPPPAQPSSLEVQPLVELYRGCMVVLKVS